MAFYLLHQEVDRDANLEKTQVKGVGSKVTIAKSRVYNRLGEQEKGQEWLTMTDTQKVSALES